MNCKALIIIVFAIGFILPSVFFFPYINSVSFLAGRKRADGKYCSIAIMTETKTVVRLVNMRNVCRLYHGRMIEMSEKLPLGKINIGDHIDCTVWFDCNIRSSHLPEHVVAHDVLWKFHLKRVGWALVWITSTISSIFGVCLMVAVGRNKKRGRLNMKHI
jgi:hypothetical protein